MNPSQPVSAHLTSLCASPHPLQEWAACRAGKAESPSASSNPTAAGLLRVAVMIVMTHGLKFRLLLRPQAPQSILPLSSQHWLFVIARTLVNQAFHVFFFFFYHMPFTKKTHPIPVGGTSVSWEVSVSIVFSLFQR